VSEEPAGEGEAQGTGESGEVELYGIKPREVYYMCLRCGHKASKSELSQYYSMVCPKCGYRTFIKVRAPSTIVAPRRVYAI
jgi:DNA-directed RNA polymerase subunit P